MNAADFLEKYKQRLETDPGRISIQRSFMMYCKSNNPAQVKKVLNQSNPLIRSCVDINCNLHHIKETSLTPLMFACIHGHHEIVKVLSRDPRIDLNKQDREGFTALHYAVAFQRRQCVFYLTERSILVLLVRNSVRKVINPNLTRYGGILPESPIIAAALVLGNSDIVSMLISLPGIKLDVKDKQGKSLAQVAVEVDLAREEFSCTSVLSKCPGVDWSFTDCLGQTLLMIACREGKAKLVSILSKVPSLNLNSQDTAGLTAAHHAVMSGSLGCLEALREVRGGGGKEGRTVNWNISYSDHWTTPLSLAVRSGYPQMVELLLSIPFVRLDQADPGERSLSQLAVESRADQAVEVVEILSRDERVSWEERDQQGDTPVISALRNKRTDMVRILLRNPRVDLSEMRSVARGEKTVEGVEAGEVEALLWEALLEVRTRLGQVEERLPRCPVCYERLRPPVLQCEEGHLLCASCGQRPELVHCPVCRGEMLGRAIGVEQFLQDLDL